MKSSLLSLIAITINSALAGINCNGSGDCAGTPGTLGDLIADAYQIDPNRWYNNGEHIACSDNRGGGGLCAFFQNTLGGPGSSVLTLLQDLQAHGCNKCGSIPVNFPQGDNSENHGELTVNFVVSAGCTGLC